MSFQWSGPFSYMCHGCEWDGSVIAFGMRDLAIKILADHAATLTAQKATCEKPEFVLFLNANLSPLKGVTNIDAPKAKRGLPSSRKVHQRGHGALAWCLTRGKSVALSVDKSEITCVKCLWQIEFYGQPDLSAEVA